MGCFYPGPWFGKWDEKNRLAVTKQAWQSTVRGVCLGIRTEVPALETTSDTNDRRICANLDRKSGARAGSVRCSAITSVFCDIRRPAGMTPPFPSIGENRPWSACPCPDSSQRLIWKAVCMPARTLSVVSREEPMFFCWSCASGLGAELVVLIKRKSRRSKERDRNRSRVGFENEQPSTPGYGG